MPFGSPAPLKPKPAASQETILARTPSYEVVTQPRAAWLLITLRGLYDDSMLGVLRGKVLSKPGSYAFDLSNLDDGTMWPTSFALTKLTAADEKRIGAHVKKAVS